MEHTNTNTFDELPCGLLDDYQPVPRRGRRVRRPVRHPNQFYLDGIWQYERQQDLQQHFEKYKMAPEMRIVAQVVMNIGKMIIESVGKEKIQEFMTKLAENAATPTNTTNNTTTNNPQTCVICMEKGINSVYLECGHAVSCYECAVKISSAKGTCPICRVVISRVMKTFGC